MALNPHHEKNLTLIPRLNRLIGQLEGLRRMIEGGRHCSELIHVAASCESAVHALRSKFIEFHVEHRLKDYHNPETSNAEKERIQEEILEISVSRKLKKR